MLLTLKMTMRKRWYNIISFVSRLFWKWRSHNWERFYIIRLLFFVFQVQSYNFFLCSVSGCDFTFKAILRRVLHNTSCFRRNTSSSHPLLCEIHRDIEECLSTWPWRSSSSPAFARRIFLLCKLIHCVDDKTYSRLRDIEICT